MQLVSIDFQCLQPAERFRLSFPLKPELYQHLETRFSPIPLLIINQNNEILFGHDYYETLRNQWTTTKNSLISPDNRDKEEKGNMVQKVKAMQTDLGEKEGLFLNYNLKNTYTGVNLFEKLVFIKKITPLAENAEIYSKTSLDISIDKVLKTKLPVLTSPPFQELLSQELVTLKSALRMCDFQDLDRAVLIDLFSKKPFSSSHQQKILEMAEEIIFRDKCALAGLFKQLGIPALLDLEKPQKAVIDALFCHRYPLYSDAENHWQTRIKELTLPSYIRIEHFPFFEKKQIEVTFQVPDITDLENLAAWLKQYSTDTKKREE